MLDYFEFGGSSVSLVEAISVHDTSEFALYHMFLLRMQVMKCLYRFKCSRASRCGHSDLAPLIVWGDYFKSDSGTFGLDRYKELIYHKLHR